MKPDSPPLEEDRLNALLALLMEQADAGVPIDLEQLIASHPDLADELQGFFDDAALVAVLAGPTIAEDSRGKMMQETSALGAAEPTTATRHNGVEVDGPVAQVPLDLPPQFGRYRIVRLLGRGGMGSVYLADDMELQRQVALKVPLMGRNDESEIVERFDREARSAARLRHPNICQVYDVGQIDGVRYLTMAFVEGRPLSNLRGASQPEIIRAVRKIACALEVAHRQGVIHRDLKPTNVMLDEQGEPVVMDFGLARLLDQQAGPRLTQLGMIVGSPSYMAPEQVCGQEVGPATDVYSLGVILYELLTDRLPFTAELVPLINKVMHEPPPSPSALRPDLDAGLEAVCLKMLAKSSADRYATMRDVAVALDNLSTISSSSADRGGEGADPRAVAGRLAKVPVKPAVRPQGASRRLRRRYLAAGVFGIAMLLGIVFFARTPTATVQLEIDIDVEDPQLGFFLDDRNIEGAVLTKPVELTAGVHELLVLKKNAVFRRYEILVKRGERSAEISLTERAPPRAQPAPDGGSTGDTVTTVPAPLSPTAVPAPEVAQERDRRAAEWVLRHEAPDIYDSPMVEVLIDGVRNRWNKIEHLPAGPFQLISIKLHTAADKEGFKNLHGLAGVRWIWAVNTHFTDEELKHLQDCQDLELLQLDSSRVTDRGMIHLSNFPKLKTLHLHHTRVTDGGMAPLAQLPSLDVLILPEGITDAGLADLKTAPKLRHLIIEECRITGAALGHLAELKSLRTLFLLGTPLTEADLRQMTGLRQITELMLSRTKSLTDEALPHIAELTKLTYLGLAETRVTDEGLKQLLPLSSLQRMDLDGTWVTDAGLETLAQFKNLQTVKLSRTAVTDAGIARFRQALPRCEVVRSQERMTAAVPYHESDEYRRLLPGVWIDLPLDTFASNPPDAWSLDDDALTFSGQPAWRHAQSDFVIGTDYAVRARVEALDAAGNEMSLWLRAGAGHVALGVNWAGKHFWGGAQSVGPWRGFGTQPATDWPGWNGKPTDPLELTAVVQGEQLTLFANGEQVAAFHSSFGPAAGGIAISSKNRCRVRDVQMQYLTESPSVIPPARIVFGDARVQLTGPPGRFTVKDLPGDLQVSPLTGVTPAVLALRSPAGKAIDYRFTIEFPDDADMKSARISGLLVGETWDVAYHALPDHAWDDAQPPVDLSDLREPDRREQATELAFRWTNVASPQAPTGPFLLTANLKADFPPGWYRLRSAPGPSVRVRMDGTVVLDNWREPTIDRTAEYLQVSAGQHHWQVDSFQPAKNRALAVVLEPVAEDAVPTITRGADATADRAAAEWALSLGGQVTVTVGNLNSRTQVASLDELPNAFRLVAINLSTDAPSKTVDAASLRGFDRLTGMTGLNLRNATVADAGLAHLAGCPTLRVLGIYNNQLTDEGLDHIAKIKTLEWLDLGNNPRVTDEGLRRLTELNQLQWISVATTKVTESGLDELAKMKTLTFIVLQGLAIGDEAVERLQLALPKAQIVR